MRIRLDTYTDIKEFVDIASTIEEPIYLKDGTGYCVSAKSLLGALASLEWEQLYCDTSSPKAYSLLKKFVI